MRDVRQGPRTPVTVHAYESGRVRRLSDHVATEEPLQVRVRPPGGAAVAVSITMRTPGDDYDLAAGFLFAEGVVRSREDVRRITYCVESDQMYNTVTAELTTLPDLAPTARHGFVSSACGVCGKTSVESLERAGLRPIRDHAAFDRAVLMRLPDTFRSAQRLFDSTGGLHAAGLFDNGGRLVALREDVGRHNALDKLIGWAMLEGGLPLTSHGIVLSGRASFELLQKAVAAEVPLVCAVGAPSSLAVDVARAFDITLVGFLRSDRFNVYSGAERIHG